jgi:hypothetical protein
VYVYIDILCKDETLEAVAAVVVEPFEGRSLFHYLYVCMYVCMYIYIYKYLYIYIYMYVCINVYVYIDILCMDGILEAVAAAVVEPFEVLSLFHYLYVCMYVCMYMYI